MVEDVGVTTSESPLHGGERGDDMGDDNTKMWCFDFDFDFFL